MNEKLIKENLIKSLNKTGRGEGLVCTANLNHEIGFHAKVIDDYLAMTVLADLLEQNKATITFNVDETDTRMEYLLRLLKAKE